ncbi:MAG: hypothetical protein RBT55_05845 [Rhodocyclaceae bacterium]|jgi:hypothetical protein|nr:hypothetical protein [Rhodocyclaceae bacterium]
MPQSRKDLAALRATLKHEDASLSRRLPATDDTAPPAASDVSAPAPETPTGEKPRRAARKPAKTVTKALRTASQPARVRAAAPAEADNEACETVSVRLLTSECQRMKALRELLARHGSPATRSDILRIGLQLALAQDALALINDIEQLSALPRKNKADKAGKVEKTGKAEKEKKDRKDKDARKKDKRKKAKS